MAASCTASGGPCETIGLLLVLWIAAHRVRRPARGSRRCRDRGSHRVRSSAGRRGLNARYYATAAAGGHERSTEHRDRAFTRVDELARLRARDHDFPLAFFNDHTRFNFTAHGRARSPLSRVRRRVDGLVVRRRRRPRCYLHAPKAYVRTLDRYQPASRHPRSIDQTEITLTEGWHRLHITFSSPYGGPREFSAGEIHDRRRREPFGVDRCAPNASTTPQQLVAPLLGVGKPTPTDAVGAWLFGVATLLLVRRLGEVWHRVRAPCTGRALALRRPPAR